MEEAETVFGRTREVLVRIRVVGDPARLSRESDLDKEFGIDSMKVMSLLVELEKEFGLELDPNEITQRTVTYMPDLLGFIERALRVKPACATPP